MVGVRNFGIILALYLLVSCGIVLILLAVSPQH